jgi:hypothetical protein
MITSEKVKVIQASDLCGTILAHKGTLSEETRGNVLEVLEELRGRGSKQDQERRVA